MSWHGSSARHRLVAAALSLAFTLALLSALVRRPPSPLQAGEVLVTTSLIFPQLSPRPEASPKQEPTPRSAQTPAATSKASVSSRKVDRPMALPPRNASPTPQQESSEPDPVAVETPPEAASAPLQTDPGTIRAALARSKGSVRQAAEASGHRLDEARPSKSEQLGAAVARAGKPDCLGPDTNGSLLSLPFIAYAALLDHCK
jgi:hypothetical protein